MGLFEAIRSRSALVVGVIGISLVAFVLTDFLTSGNMLFQGDRDVVGRIQGEKISYLEFNKEVEELSQNPQYGQATPLQISELVWNNLLNEKLLVNPMSELGFTVTTEELTKVIEMSPSVQQMPGLQDPNTGQFRPDLLRSALQNLRDQRESSPEAAAQWDSWVAYEQDVKNQALSIGLTSYDGGLFFGLNADRDAVPDLDDLASSLVDALRELREAVRAPGGDKR